jgi:diaminopimelate decarboxylase
MNVVAVESEGRISIERAAQIFRNARGSGLLSSIDTAVIFHDLGLLEQRIKLLQHFFPASAIHALAIKANPLVAVLKCAVESGAGMEAASIEEVHLALAAGCPPERIVFDSPAKTNDELAFALQKGIHINADSLEELDRIAELVSAGNAHGSIGLRINPVVGTGSIAMTSVAGRSSHFGVALDDTDRDVIIRAFRSYPWLCGLHSHVGSQGCELSLLTAAASRIWELRQAIHNTIGHAQITTVDIGGGIPALYSDAESYFTFQDYVAALKRDVPGLFSPDIRLITEFGRSIQANCGFSVAKVESVKKTFDQQVAVIHLGADFLLRPVYQPEFWHHDCVLLDACGHVKTGVTEPWSLAGPLCFSGDFIARSIMMPKISSGDYILIRDIGAYTLGLWSRHCSRAIPLILGYNETNSQKIHFVTLRHRETYNGIVSFWSP